MGAVPDCGVEFAEIGRARARAGEGIGVINLGALARVSAGVGGAVRILMGA